MTHKTDCAIHGCEGWNGDRVCDCGVEHARCEDCHWHGCGTGCGCKCHPPAADAGPRQPTCPNCGATKRNACENAWHLEDEATPPVPQEAAPPPTKLTRQQALLAYVEWHGGCHSQECSMDDTCDCAGKPINYVINEMCRVALAAPQEARRCSATSPHVAHTFGGRPMQYCEGVTEPEKCSCECHTKGFAGCHLCFCRVPEWQAATAPDSAMRVAREVIKYVESTGDNGAIMDEQVAKVIREAGSERERELRDEIEFLKQLKRSTSPCGHLARFAKTDDGGKHITCLECDLAEASRLLGGE